MSQNEKPEKPSLKFTGIVWIVAACGAAGQILMAQYSKGIEIGYYGRMTEWFAFHYPHAIHKAFVYGVVGVVIGGAIDASRRGGNWVRSAALGGALGYLGKIIVTRWSLHHLTLEPGSVDALSALSLFPSQRYLLVYLAAFAGLEFAALKEPNRPRATPVILLLVITLFSIGIALHYKSAMGEFVVLMVGLILHQMFFSAYRSFRKRAD